MKSGLTEADAGNRAAIAHAVYVFNPDRVARPDANAGRPVLLRERAENLYYFAAQLERNQSIAVGIKSRHGFGFRHDRGLESLSRMRFEAEERIEYRAHYHALEQKSSNERDRECESRPDQPLDDQPGCAESDQNVEHHARREPRPEVRPPAISMDVSVVRVSRRRWHRMVCVGGRWCTVVRVRKVAYVRVRATDAMHFVPAGVVTVMASAVAAREPEERHRGHAGGAENHTENVEVHLKLKIHQVVGCQRLYGN